MEDVEMMTKKHHNEVQQQELEAMITNHHNEAKKQAAYACPTRQPLKSRKVKNENLKEKLKPYAIAIATVSLVALGAVGVAKVQEVRNNNIDQGIQVQSEMLEYYKDYVSPDRYVPNEFFNWQRSDAGQEKRAEIIADMSEEQGNAR